MKEVAVFWFRRDLRLHDNHGLYKALTSKEPVLPIFIFDTEILHTLPKNDARVSFIYQQLVKLNTQLEQFQSSIFIFNETPLEAFKKLIDKYSIRTVYTNHDYEPYARERDKQIKEYLKTKGISFLSFKDQVIYEKNEIIKNDGTPYVVYTPYSKKWLEHFNKNKLQSYNSEKHLANLVSNNSFSFPSIESIGFKPSTIQVPEHNISSSLLSQYESTRNYPALNNTSQLGPHLRFGTVSIRKIVKKAKQEPNQTFLKELIWREFFMQILWHFPHTQNKAFKPQYDRIVWRNNENEFQKWCEGKTGFPLVDAGMRQLNETGFMHNRVRMVVGSFLCKHILIDWRWGEAYFAEKLLDYEMASNIGNWQWVAGCGVDAAPYFRIFNPTSQIQKFDKKQEYIKRWVSDFQELTYPNPIVDHKFARERCLKTYKEALG